MSIVEEMVKEIRDKSDVECIFFQSAADVPDPRKLSSEKTNLMVFHDLLLKKQNTRESSIHVKQLERTLPHFRRSPVTHCKKEVLVWGSKLAFPYLNAPCMS